MKYKKYNKDTPRITRILLFIVSLLLISAASLIVANNIFVPFVIEILPEILRNSGIGGDNIRIAGTGSMYPTFPKGVGQTDISRANEIVAWSSMKRFPGGINIFGFKFFSYNLKYKDIISFANEKTKEISLSQYGEEAGFIKRIIGLPGDRLEIKEGFVFRNGEQLKEEYTARAVSTFGGLEIKDCQEVVVPEGEVFVLGDNRIASSDSRDKLGFVKILDIDHVLSYDEQKPYSKLWRDPSSDDKLINQPTLDGKKYVELLNQKREENKLSPLKWNAKLEKSAKLRADNMLKTGDLSFEATVSGYSINDSMNDANYYNTAWGEAPTIGYYTEDELIENSFGYAQTKKFLLEEDFDDVGVSAVIGNLNGCPQQLIVQHFGGYVPPNYSQEIITNWKNALKNLKEVQPGWEKLLTYPIFYEENKRDIDRINEILDIRISNITKIIIRMDNNEWLDSEEKKYTSLDSTYANEQDILANKLNSKTNK